jgi:hypothetical protein
MWTGALDLSMGTGALDLSMGTGALDLSMGTGALDPATWMQALDHSTTTRSPAPRPKVSGAYISSAFGGGTTKEPGVVARAT